MEKQKKQSKIRQDQNTLTAIAENLFMEGRLDPKSYLYQIWDIQNISLFPKILSLKSFGNSYTKVFILDMKSHGT